MRDVLERTGWSAERWGREAGVAPTTITRFIGRQNAVAPTSRTIAKLEAAARVPLKLTSGGMREQSILTGLEVAQAMTRGGPDVLQQTTGLQSGLLLLPEDGSIVALRVETDDTLGAGIEPGMVVVVDLARKPTLKSLVAVLVGRRIAVYRWHPDAYMPVSFDLRAALPHGSGQLLGVVRQAIRQFDT